MKILPIIVALLLTTFYMYGQASADTLNQDMPDTTYIELKNKTIIIIEKIGSKESNIHHEKGDHNEEMGTNSRSFESNFGGFEFGLNGYLTPENSFSLSEENRYLELEDSRSFEINLQLIDIAIPIVKDRIGLVSGLGISWNNYRFENKTHVLQNDSSVLYYDTINQDFNKNKLTTTYLMAPLALEFHFPSADKEIWVLAGAFAELKMGSYVKHVTTDGDKEKAKEDFHLNTFRYGLRAQVGVNSWSIYCSYTMTPLFKKDEGPELYQ
ncbi:MAG: outer membrane beta-barrel protein, partial [Salinivirgaceae bacterium]|nr:outer membrane beta-barrel protein [Salinivirgaceae bacterium]